MDRLIKKLFIAIGILIVLSIITFVCLKYNVSKLRMLRQAQEDSKVINKK